MRNFKSYSGGLFFCLFLAGIGFLFSGCGDNKIQNFEFREITAPEKKPFLIGQVPSRSIIQLLEQQKQFASALEKQIDREVQFRFAATYGEIIKKLKQGRYQLAILGPFAYVQASRNSNYTPLVRPVRYGKPYYRSIIFTHENSEVTSPSELEGKSIAFVDPDSTSGYLFPRGLLIRKHGFDPFDEATRHKFLGGHDKVASAVLDERFTAGATFVGARELVADNPEKKLPELARTEPIPSEPYVISEKLRKNKELREKITQFFRKLHEQDTEALHSLGKDIEKFAPAEDADYDQVRKVQSTLKKHNGTNQ